MTREHLLPAEQRRLAKTDDDRRVAWQLLATAAALDNTS